MTATHPSTTWSADDVDHMVAAQVRDVRRSLLSDAGDAHVDTDLVDAAIGRALATYGHRRVRAHVGVLIERTVRDELGLLRRRTTDGTRGP